MAQARQLRLFTSPAPWKVDKQNPHRVLSYTLSTADEVASCASLAIANCVAAVPDLLDLLFVSKEAMDLGIVDKETVDARIMSEHFPNTAEYDISKETAAKFLVALNKLCACVDRLSPQLNNKMTIGHHEIWQVDDLNARRVINFDKEFVANCTFVEDAKYIAALPALFDVFLIAEAVAYSSEGKDEQDYLDYYNATNELIDLLQLPTLVKLLARSAVNPPDLSVGM